MQNNVLILGGNGMAGHLIALYLSEHNMNVDILCRKEFTLSDSIKTIVWNEKFQDLEGIINSGYNIIVNCIGMLNSACDKCPIDAIRINSYLPHFLATRIKTKTKLVHLSTDCVFSGKHAPYDELSIPDGTSVYDVSKAAGELIISDHSTVLRSSIIGPDINENGIGLFNWFMHQSTDINGYDNWIWSGITTLEMAKQILIVIERDLSGLFHLTNNVSISKYELLNIVNLTFNRKIKIQRSSLDNKIDKTLISNNSSFKIPSYQVMIDEMKEWIVNHKEIYWYE